MSYSGKSALISDLLEEFRVNSTKTVMFHQAVADLFGLNATDHKSLGFIISEGSMTAGDLASRTGLTTGAITGVIDRLEAAGFVMRKAEPNDRRRVLIEAVPNATQKLEMVFAPFTKRMTAALSEFSVAELEATLKILKESDHELDRTTDLLKQQRVAA